MSRQRHQLQPAWLLNARPYSDSSLLLEVFTRDQGRVGLIAKGARGPKSKLRSLLQPLQPLLLSWNQTGELGTLTGAEAAGAAIVLGGERVFFAWYVNELLLKLLQRQDAHAGLFDAYSAALSQLAGAQAEASLRIFEMRLLGEIGYGLPLPEPLDAGTSYDYAPGEGFTPATGRDAIAGSSLLALREERLEDPRALADARKLLRAAIASQLGDRRLETPRLLRELRGTLAADDEGN